MANPLFNMMQSSGGNDIIRQFQAFKQNFNGDPRQQIQQMLNSGRVTQAQYNRAVQIANQLSKMLG